MAKPSKFGALGRCNGKSFIVKRPGKASLVMFISYITGAVVPISFLLLMPFLFTHI